MRFNAAGEALIKKYEGFSLKPYLCPTGHWTIGWGHTRGVTSDMPPITNAQAEDFFDQDIALAVGQVSNLVEVPLNDNQFSALVSITFNEGTAPLMRTLGAKINTGDFEGAADQFARWVYGTQPDGQMVILPGLVARRADEEKLFLTKVANV